MHNDRYRKGGPHDDVAQNIRNEMQADAAPSPEEAAAEEQRWLAKNGCAECDEDDPDKLTAQHRFTHSCSRFQHPELYPKVVCEDHQTEDLREAYIRSRMDDYENDDAIVAVAIYDCDVVQSVAKEPMPTIDVGDGEEIDDPRARPEPKAPIRHRCGSELTEIRFLEDNQ